MKICKSRESFCLSIVTIYTNDCSTFWHVYWCHVYFFLWDSYICANQEQAGPPRSGFYESGLPSLPSWLGMVNAGWLGSIRSKIFLEWNLSFFKAVPSNRLSSDLGSPFHLISSVFNYLCLFQNAILHNMLKLGFWNFKPIFLRMQFSLVGTFFSLVLVISLSWYFHLTFSYLILVTWHFGSQMVPPNI